MFRETVAYEATGRIVSSLGSVSNTLEGCPPSKGKPRLIIMIGLPGSGKSTYRAKLVEQMIADKRDFYVASTDDYLEDTALRTGHTYNDAFELYLRQAEDIYFSIFAKARARGADLIVDRTNLSESSRAKLIRPMLKDYRIEGYFLNPSRDEHQRRIKGRTDKFIPEHVINLMRSRLEPPKITEHFHYIEELV